MTKAERRQVRKSKRAKKQIDQLQGMSSGLEKAKTPSSKPLEAKTEAQGHYMLAIERQRLIFGVGPAGTGKTHVCATMAADALLDGKIEKIVVTRPAVEAGESFGFLPGELEEKYEPYLVPVRDTLVERLGKGRVEYMLKSGQIEAAPLAFMRGRTFRNAFVILDEAQNTTPTQMKMFLTRIGPGCTVIVNGDIRQKDIVGQSGLEDAMARLKHLPAVRVIEFSRDDVVRSGLVQQIIEAYEDKAA